jgi:hypothetical protein
MPQLSPSPITAQDLLEYLSDSSDLGFELRTLRLLRSQGLQCEHGGLYKDPVTSKARQFDIRAIARTDHHSVRLAVECKNIGAHFPLLVSCVPRHGDESFHEIAIVGEIEDGQNRFGMYEHRAHIVRITDPESLYRTHLPVGKSLTQIGRAANREGSIWAADQDVFEKWAQSLASAEDLVSASNWEGSDDSPSISYVAVIPIVVVPDSRLWMVEYDSDGERKTEPVQADQCSLFVNREYRMDLNGPCVHVSHVEFLTLSRLGVFVSECLKDRVAMEAIFPHETIVAAVENLREGH